MLSHTEFNDLLITELHQYRVFSFYDEEALTHCIPQKLTLTYERMEPIGYYKKLMSFDLAARSVVSPLLRQTIAVCELVFTSSESEFDFGRALSDDSTAPDRRVYAVNISVRISQRGHYCLAGLRKRLWSSDPPQIEGIPEYVQLLTY
jgi:hypothetical protein